MESRELRYFLVVAEEANFTHAAARLFVTQPALSRVVRQIERDLGTLLFVRTNKGATLTAAGEVLLREGRAALEGLDRAVLLTRAVPDARPGTGRVSRPVRRLPSTAAGDGHLDQTAC